LEMGTTIRFKPYLSTINNRFPTLAEELTPGLGRLSEGRLSLAVLLAISRASFSWLQLKIQNTTQL